MDISADDFDYLTDCQACDGSGTITNYSGCPACGGDGRLNRKEIAPDGFVRISEEYHRDNEFVSFENIPLVSDEDERDGLLELEDDKSINEAVEEMKNRGDDYTADIYSDLIREPNSPFEI